MAYINQEGKAKIAEALKPILAKYKVKGTLSIQHKSTITLTIKSSPIDFIGNYNDVLLKKGVVHGTPSKCLDVNPYWFKEHFTGIALQFLTEAFEALKSNGWFDKSDISTDYFHTAYYVGIDIGKWDKPYQIAA
jgi:hypothetical protein